MIKYLDCVIVMLFYVSSVMSANRLSDCERLDVEILKRKNYLIQKDSLIGQLKYSIEKSGGDAISFYLADNVFDAYKFYQCDSVHADTCKILLFSGGDFRGANSYNATHRIVNINTIFIIIGSRVYIVN